MILTGIRSPCLLCSSFSLRLETTTDAMSAIADEERAINSVSYNVDFADRRFCTSIWPLYKILLFMILDEKRHIPETISTLSNSSVTCFPKVPSSKLGHEKCECCVETKLLRSMPVRFIWEVKFNRLERIYSLSFSCTPLAWRATDNSRVTSTHETCLRMRFSGDFSGIGDGVWLPVE